LTSILKTLSKVFSASLYPDYICLVKHKPFKITTWPTTLPLVVFSGQATEGSTVSSIKCDRCWHLD